MKYVLVVAGTLILVGLVLILDEISMLFPTVPLPPSGWLLGDMSVYHIEPWHHWMLGIVFMIGGGIALRRL